MLLVAQIVQLVIIIYAVHVSSFAHVQPVTVSTHVLHVQPVSTLLVATDFHVSHVKWVSTHPPRVLTLAHHVLSINMERLLVCLLVLNVQ